MKIVAFSDTHAQHRDVTLPDGDVLVFSGDLMGSGYKHNEVKDFAEWWNNHPHRVKILVAGNHDRMFESDLGYCLNKFNNTVYLHDREIIEDGIKFWGSPVQPWFYDWAFNVHRGAPIKKHWDKIPDGTDVLITHGPPYGILDQMVAGQYATDHVGCEELILAVNRVKPRVHIFGHIHGSYGVTETPDTNFHNVAICDEQYNPENKPHQIYIERM